MGVDHRGYARLACLLTPRMLLGQKVDDLPPPAHDFRQRRRLGVGRATRGRFQHTAESRQKPRVERVGLGLYAFGPGESTGLMRRDPADLKAGLRKRFGDALFIAAGRLQNHMGDA